MYGILLIVLVISLSGFISYLGDQIGMKVGKRRISLFGLRPRYTSIIITVLTGILIATLTLTIILVTNNGVRQAIFRIQEVLSRIDDLNQQVITKDQQLADLKVEIDLKGEELAIKSQKLAELQEEQQQLEAELASTREEYQLALEDINQLTQKQKGLQEKVSSLEEQRADLEGQINDLKQELSQVREDYEIAKNLAYQYQAGIKYYMGEDILYRRGDIIYSDVIKGGLSEEETIQAIIAFLEKADQEVKKQPVEINPDSGTALYLQQEDIFNLARNILNSNAEKVIINLLASINIPKNERVVATFEFKDDFIVFQAGELITSAVIDGSKSPLELEKDLEELLTQIKVTAVKKGLLADAQGSVGALNFSQFYQLLNQIKNYQQEVEVRVYAQEEIWREHRLSSNLRFEIKALEGGDNDSGS